MPDSLLETVKARPEAANPGVPAHIKDWCEQNIALPSITITTPGKRVRLQKYQREIQISMTTGKVTMGPLMRSGCICYTLLDAMAARQKRLARRRELYRLRKAKK